MKTNIGMLQLSAFRFVRLRSHLKPTGGCRCCCSSLSSSYLHPLISDSDNGPQPLRPPTSLSAPIADGPGPKMSENFRPSVDICIGRGRGFRPRPLEILESKPTLSVIKFLTRQWAHPSGNHSRRSAPLGHVTWRRVIGRFLNLLSTRAEHLKRTRERNTLAYLAK